MKNIFCLLSVIFLINGLSYAQVNIKLPAVTITGIYSKQPINLSSLPQDGKSKVVLITAQSNKDRNLIGRILDNNANGNTVPLYVVSVTDRAIGTIGADQKDFNFLSAEEYEEAQKYKVYFYSDKQKEILKKLKPIITPLYFFLDAENNVVYCYEKNDISADKLINLYNLINTNVITANNVLYFDKNWFPTTKTNAVYYRKKISKEGNLYNVEDYYMDGKPQMKGTCTSVYPRIYDGAFTFYNENGILETERTYVKNRLNGLYKNYYPSGKIYSTYTYVNDTINGVLNFYYETGAKYNSGVLVKNNLLEGPAKLLYDNGEIKALINYKNNQLDGPCVGYDVNKNLLFNVYFSNGFVDATHPVAFYNSKGDKTISEYRDYAKYKNTTPLYREFKYKLPDGNILEVGEFKDGEAGIYKQLFNIPSDEKDFFYFAFKRPGKKENNLLQNGVFNAKGKIIDIRNYNGKGAMSSMLSFKNGQLDKGKYFYANGTVCFSYDSQNGKGIQKFGEDGKEVYIDGMRWINFIKENGLKDTEFVQYSGASLEKTAQLEKALLDNTFYLPEALISNFLTINGNWSY